MTLEILPKNVLDTLIDAGVAVSRAQARRLVQAGAVKIDGQRVSEPSQLVDVSASELSVGKRRLSLAALRNVSGTSFSSDRYSV